MRRWNGGGGVEGVRKEGKRGLEVEEEDREKY